MALIKCPECGSSVSSVAEACPRCAYPLSGGGTTQAHGGRVQTVEKTAKSYKLEQLLAALVTIVCFIMTVQGCRHGLEGKEPPSLPILGLLAGVVWSVAVKFKIWWNHG